jgi:eukaryotic-like serine/threonine-protein kinase
MRKHHIILITLIVGLILFVMGCGRSSQTDPKMLETTVATHTPIVTLTITLPSLPTIITTPTPAVSPTNTFQQPTTTPSYAPSQTETPITTQSAPLVIGAMQVSEKDGMVQVYVPAGDFLMGAVDSDKYASSDEKPQHTVYLDAFWIDKTEVTNILYQKCVKAGACINTSESHNQGANYPVIRVNWNQASAYCKWVGRRLPSEAEWEKAARGTDGRLYPWGNTGDCLKAPFYGCGPWEGPRGTDAVGSYPDGASPYGVLDMAGTVWEWVNDWYDETYYQDSPDSNPEGPSSGAYHVLRGSSWVDKGRLDRASGRDMYLLIYSFGFRCAR